MERKKAFEVSLLQCSLAKFSNEMSNFDSELIAGCIIMYTQLSTRAELLEAWLALTIC